MSHSAGLWQVGGQRPLVALFLVSLVGLFLQVMLIRWIGTEVRIFAYLQNTILVTCFLGLGLGCFWSSRPVHVGLTLWPLAILAALLALGPTRNVLHHVTEWMAPLAQSVAWTGGPGL